MSQGLGRPQMACVDWFQLVSHIEQLAALCPLLTLSACAASPDCNWSSLEQSGALRCDDGPARPMITSAASRARWHFGSYLSPESLQSSCALTPG